MDSSEKMRGGYFNVLDAPLLPERNSKGLAAFARSGNNARGGVRLPLSGSRRVSPFCEKRDSGRNAAVQPWKSGALAPRQGPEKDRGLQPLRRETPCHFASRNLLFRNETISRRNTQIANYPERNSKGLTKFARRTEPTNDHFERRGRTPWKSGASAPRREPEKDRGFSPWGQSCATLHRMEQPLIAQPCCDEKAATLLP